MILLAIYLVQTEPMIWLQHGMKMVLLM